MPGAMEKFRQRRLTAFSRLKRWPGCISRAPGLYRWQRATQASAIMWLGRVVMGLRRGFVQAGVQNLLMTLWPVTDVGSG